MTVPPPGRQIPDCSVFAGDEFGRDGAPAFRTTQAVAYVGDDFSGAIQSIIVHAGWWRFYVEQDFHGQHLDLGAGEHRLPPEWSGRIQSYEPVAF